LYVHCIKIFFGDVGPRISPKDFNMAKKWFTSTRSFFYDHPLDNFASCEILNIVGTIDVFIQKLWGKTSRMDYTIFHLLQCTIIPLRNTILLWTVGNNMLQLNTFSGTIFFKFMVDVFTAIIYPHTFDRLYRLFFQLRI